MKICVREIRDTNNRRTKEKKRVVLEEQHFELAQGFVPFVGERENFPYDSFIFIRSANEEEAEILFFPYQEVLKELHTLKKDEPITYVSSHPRSSTSRYIYKIEVE